MGFVVGFVGWMGNGRFKHASHMMGIHPEFQGQGIGTQLKLAQRQIVQQQGLDLITWTYDPLEVGNALEDGPGVDSIITAFDGNLRTDVHPPV